MSPLARARAEIARAHIRPFLGMIDAVLVDGEGEFDFTGAIRVTDARAVWLWMVRDLGQGLLDLESATNDEQGRERLEAAIPELIARAKDALIAAQSSIETTRRLRAQLGGETAWDRLPMVMTAVQSRALLSKAQEFGSATNGMTDDATLTLALQSLPLSDPAVSALMMHAAIGHVANPSRLIMAVIRLADEATEMAFVRSGYGPLIDAILAHAQNQLPSLAQVGAFGDTDLLCRAIDRYHRLMRAVIGYVELTRGSRWANITAALTTSISNQLEPRLQNVPPDVTMALRRMRETNDRLDSDQILAALNGMYLLSTVRDCRDSLAVNAVFDQVWNLIGETLEIQIERNLDNLRANPADRVTSARLDAALKMAELRFNAEYAEVMRRAKDVTEKRPMPGVPLSPGL